MGRSADYSAGASQDLGVDRRWLQKTQSLALAYAPPVWVRVEVIPRGSGLLLLMGNRWIGDSEVRFPRIREGSGDPGFLLRGPV